MSGDNYEPRQAPAEGSDTDSLLGYFFKKDVIAMPTAMEILPRIELFVSL